MGNLLSVEELIKQKAKYKMDDATIKKKLFIKRLNASIEIEVTKGDVTDFLEITNKKDVTEKEAEAAGFNLVYSIVREPNLRDKELQTAFECNEPTDIVEKIFSDGEMLDIVDVAIDLTGFRKGTVSLVEDLKN
ncbi:phage tail assembly chaperone [Lysinibacillus fusiformis]|uniref:Phage XkdN-like tail assembly chaperone protein, TAC n=1 Tax=Lysinibacillus fusiformis TaxID=28031 RepID=A0A1H9HB43_9BACI|nr:hypothetical protein [Lysinibacillus fusiformis]SCY30339.1 Phage XkdN-like tail assembly chaperone protein, TAC [Lysinibacillus fusiformis]SEN53428.1 Phage XkdN-like tail assembly chaperone protein, TAC [Lysinibacillus fusiformis]SEQ59544.1 Phage XkdN-like tail assembly chaperone protein, TAC [Lysinibacillus fusiformis]